METEGEKDTKTTVTSDMLGGEKQEEVQEEQQWIRKSVAALQSALKPLLLTEGRGPFLPTWNHFFTKHLKIKLF